MFLMFARFEQIRSGDLRYLDPEGRRKFYQALKFWAEVDRDGTVTLTGVFPEAVSLPDLMPKHLDKT